MPYSFLPYYLWLTKCVWIDNVGSKGSSKFKVMTFQETFQYFKNGFSKRRIKHKVDIRPRPYWSVLFHKKNMLAILSSVFCIIKNLLVI